MQKKGYRHYYDDGFITPLLSKTTYNAKNGEQNIMLLDTNQLNFSSISL